MNEASIFSHVVDTWAGGDDLAGREAAALGLMGELGEVVDLYKKMQFKPNFTATADMFADELGDVGYYIAISAMYSVHDWESNMENWLRQSQPDTDLCTSMILAWMVGDSASVAKSLILQRFQPRTLLAGLVNGWVTLISRLTLNTPQEIMEANKLKLAGGRHGWPSQSREG